MVTKNNILTISGAIVFKDYRARRKFLVVKVKDEEGWEFPKVTVRRGESSVRAAIRMTGEQAGMNARVLEEAGRFSGTAQINGKSIPQKHLYYIMLQKSGGEIMGFEKFLWLYRSVSYQIQNLTCSSSLLLFYLFLCKFWRVLLQHFQKM